MIHKQYLCGLLVQAFARIRLCFFLYFDAVVRCELAHAVHRSVIIARAAIQIVL